MPCRGDADVYTTLSKRFNEFQDKNKAAQYQRGGCRQGRLEPHAGVRAVQSSPPDFATCILANMFTSPAVLQSGPFPPKRTVCPARVHSVRAGAAAGGKGGNMGNMRALIQALPQFRDVLGRLSVHIFISRWGCRRIQHSIAALTSCGRCRTSASQLRELCLSAVSHTV